MKRPLQIAGLVLLAIFGAGTLRDPEFWQSNNRRGDALMMRHLYHDAALAYRDPMRGGIALYRDGDFKEAAAAFARVPGPEGPYNAATARLMHGEYDLAITGYDSALAIRPGWKEAMENKAIATARRDLLKASGKNRDQESADAYDPDDVIADAKGESETGDREPSEAGAPDAALQATWLRRVKTTPGQFLKAKFAWQAQSEPPPSR